MIRKTLAMGGRAWSTSENSSKYDNIDFYSGGCPISFCWTELHWKATISRDGEITSYSWSANE